MTTCPTCHQEVAPKTERVVVLLDENTLTYCGARIHLKGRQAEVVSVLAETPGRAVTREHIVERVWGLSETDWSARSLDQHIMGLRRALEPMGIKITTIWGRGFRLDVA